MFLDFFLTLTDFFLTAGWLQAVGSFHFNETTFTVPSHAHRMGLDFGDLRGLVGPLFLNPLTLLNTLRRVQFCQALKYCTRGLPGS